MRCVEESGWENKSGEEQGWNLFLQGQQLSVWLSCVRKIRHYSLKKSSTNKKITIATNNSYSLAVRLLVYKTEMDHH